ncbi:hypothetical protein H1R17_14145 [Flavobacterium sp. xlx-214]|uniref:hypothetical protein n=1 Tax=unclassified Flavobacterium TaxID=196869 RepID=UPI0013D5D608|nr:MULTISPECIES: hypothetical protein [unclassified Flavobacterium]MBA5791263.1 hypothetical protein [Flavobacterium sp. xlx-221]QMI83575.1 hypothetical protein H1R17_14145 [Flavobacterium sp. xlx-214]
MRNLVLFICLFCSFIGFSQSPVAVKVRLYKSDAKAVLSVQKNNDRSEKIEQNVFKNFDLKTNDVLSFYINNNLVETLEVSSKVIERKSLSVLITESTVLDEVEIEYTNLNNKLGLDGTKYTKAERAVKKDKQITYDDKYSATGNIKLDGLVNKLSGRAKTNKKVLSVENEINAMERFLSVYSADYLYKNYKLPKEKAPYFALKMIDYIQKDTKIDSDSFRMLMEEQLLNFKYD